MAVVEQLPYANILNKFNEENQFNDEKFNELTVPEKCHYYSINSTTEHADQIEEQNPWFDHNKIHSNSKCTIL